MQKIPITRRNILKRPGALLDFWQCDEKGEYDTNGFSLRGHQYANSKGGPVLTTQLYLPNHPGNEKDFLFNPSLSMVQQGQDFFLQFVLPANVFSLEKLATKHTS